MTGKIESKILSELLKHQDLKYREFECKLMPTVDPKTVIGVRTPDIRSLAKEFSKDSEISDFLNLLPHRYYEENNIHGFIIENMRDFDKAVYETDRFLPYINNWATCDLISPNIFRKHLSELLCKIREWISSDKTYTVRFGIGMLMRFYLDEEFKPEYNEMTAKVKSEEYYVNMMRAWYFATALAKQYSATVPYLEEKTLDKWTHNKTICKAVESYRISDEQKIYLKSLKVK
ncbi:MAG: DNA alkylation repair protein [Acutalibacteraceae bacterium]